MLHHLHSAFSERNHFLHIVLGLLAGAERALGLLDAQASIVVTTEPPDPPTEAEEQATYAALGALSLAFRLIEVLGRAGPVTQRLPVQPTPSGSNLPARLLL